MSIVAYPIQFELVVDTVTRQKRIRCSLTAEPEVVAPGWEWPLALPTYTGIGTTMEEAIQNAWAAYRTDRG